MFALKSSAFTRKVNASGNDASVPASLTLGKGKLVHNKNICAQELNHYRFVSKDFSPILTVSVGSCLSTKEPVSTRSLT